MERLMVGAGIAEIRLPEPLPQNRENFVRILDPLHVRVLLLRSQKQAAIVSMELTSMMSGIDALRTRVGTLTGTDPAYVWITVTHTFSAPHIQAEPSGGPGGPGGPGPGGPGGSGPGGPGGPPPMAPEELEENAKQTEALLRAVEEAAAQAAEKLQMSKMGYGSGVCGVNAGRDVETAEGWWLGEGSNAYADRSLHVLRFDDDSGRPLAAIFNYAVQSSVLDHAEMPGGGYVVSGDISGAAAQLAEARYPGMVALFLCGAAGDQAPRQKGNAAIPDADGNLTEIQRGLEGVAIKDALGVELGEALCAVLERAVPEQDAAVIAAERRCFQVPAKVMPDRAELRARKSMEYQADGFRETDVDILRIGDAAIVGVKPELSAVIGTQIREKSPFAATLVATMVNGGAKYMADMLAFSRFTYAAQNGPFAAGAAEILRDHAVALLKEMAGQA